MDEKRICIIGLGGAGCRMVGQLAASAREGPVLAAVSTDRRALSESAASSKIQIGVALTKGLGTGGDVAVGRLAAEEDESLIRGLVADMDLVFLVMGLGGGTATGAAPAILHAARDEGAMTLCFATLPFAFEGRPRQAAAEEAIPELRELADALIVMPNDRLAEKAHKNRVAQAFTKVDQVVGIGLRGIWKLLTHPGYINLDFASLRSVMAASDGRCTFAYGEGKGKNRVADVLKELLESPLLEGGALLASAGSVVVSIMGGPDLTLKEVGDVMQGVTAVLAPDCQPSMGTIIDEVCHDKLTVVVVVAEGRREASERRRPAAPKLRTAAASGKRPAKCRKPLQTKLGFDTTKGRFKDVEPTIHEGEDLDIPTFIRRGISV